jgi:hypothetical protein
MKRLDMKKIIFLSTIVLFVIASCDNNDRYGDPGYTNPVIETLAVSPTTFNFGDKLTVTANVSDPGTNLFKADISIYANDQLISTHTVYVDGMSDQINESVAIPMAANLSNNSAITFKMTLSNLTKRTAEQSVTGLTGTRPHFGQLYLVLQNGDYYTLSPQAGNTDLYSVNNLALNSNFNYLIAEKMTSDGKIDFSGLVWGSVNGKLALVSESDYNFGYVQNVDYVNSFAFDSYSFTTSINGEKATGMTLSPESFTESVKYGGEDFITGKFNIEKDQVITLLGDMNDNQIIYHLDFFDRIAPNKIKFLGETGSYTLNYNKYRKHLIVGVTNPAYPNYLLITGGGIGYPTKVQGIAVEHCWWGFDDVRQFLLGRKIADNVYQFTMMFHTKDDSWVSFKPYENTGWGGEKRFDQMSSFTGDKILESTDGNNWCPNASVTSSKAYQITINWATNAVDVKTITL